jgi:hypothetical protein
VSKGLLLTTVIFSLVAQLTKKTSLFNLDLTQVGQGQVSIARATATDGGATAGMLYAINSKLLIW